MKHILFFLRNIGKINFVQVQVLMRRRSVISYLDARFWTNYIGPFFVYKWNGRDIWRKKWLEMWIFPAWIGVFVFYVQYFVC